LRPSILLALLLVVPHPLLAGTLPQAPITVRLDGNSSGRVFEGIGLVNASGTSKLLMDYPEEQARAILDLLFKPFHGAGFTILKNEIGADVNSSTGAEPCHRRSKEERAVARGVNFWMAKEALARNPDMVFAAGRWGIPAWADATDEDRTEYYLDYVRTMGLNGTPLRDLSPGENEVKLDRDWTVHKLFPALQSGGFPYVRLIAKDEIQSWKLADELKKDKELRKVLRALTSHYTTESTEAARSCGLPLYNDEADVPMRDATSRLFLVAKNLAKQYVDGRMTRALLQPGLDGVYASIKFNHKGILSADTPWSGHFEAHRSLWMVAHFTQFAPPGWRFLDKACGQGASDVYHLTLRSPSSPDYSVILVNASANDLEYVFQLSKDLSHDVVHVWRTDRDVAFSKDEDVTPEKGVFKTRLAAYSILSLTTTVGQHKGETGFVPPPQPLALPTRDDFTGKDLGSQPRYFLDQVGAFELAERDGARCLEQVVTTPPIEWWGGAAQRQPYSVFGDLAWADTLTEVSVLLPEGASAYVGSRGNLHDRDRVAPSSGYQLCLASDGAWAFRKVVYGDAVTFAQGKAEGFDAKAWHRLSVAAKGASIEAFLDNKSLGKVTDSDLAFGQGSLGCTYHKVRFRDLAVLPSAESPTWAFVNDRDPRVVYQGEWADVDGDWKDTERSSRRSKTLGATAEMAFEGTGVCWLGRRSGEGGLCEVSLDGGAPVTVDTYREGDLHRAPLFHREGLSPGKHTLRIATLAREEGGKSWVSVDALMTQPLPVKAVAPATDPGDLEALSIPMDEEPTPTPAPKAKKKHTAKTPKKTVRS